MTTFQGIVYAVLFGFTAFLPVSWTAHAFAVSYFIEWPEIAGATHGALAAGGTLALLVYFRHDWASIISSFLRVVLFFQKPRTIDERLLFFLVLTTLPYLVTRMYFPDFQSSFIIHPLWIAGYLFFFSIPLIAGEYLNRKTKNMLNWNTTDAIVTGVTQLIYLIPGAGRQIGALSGILLRNYDRDSAVKYLYLSFFPILMIETFIGLSEVDFSAPSAGFDISWLTFGTMFAVSFFFGLLTIGGFVKNIKEKSWKPFLLYRTLLAAGITAFYWYQNY